MTSGTFDAGITFCGTNDLEATSAFYEGLLGLPMVLDQGTCRIYRVRDGCYVGFCRRDEVPETGGVVLTLVADDVDGWYARLSKAGVPLEKALSANAEYRIYHFYVKDPNGYLVEVQRFDDPDWSVEDR